MNTRPVVLVFLLLVLVITSQFEWKQQIGDAAADPDDARRRHQGLAKEDAVKEKVRASNPSFSSLLFGFFLVAISHFFGYS